MEGKTMKTRLFSLGVVLTLIITAFIGFGGTVSAAAPDQPEIADGETEGAVNVTYVFEVEAVNDTDGDDVYYMFDWGDGLDTGWMGPYEPLQMDPIEAEHKWEKGYYEIKVKAIDDPNGDGDLSDGTETAWSDPWEISIGHRFQVVGATGGFGFSVSIENTLEPSKYCDYKIEVAGGSLPGLHYREVANGTVFIQSGSVGTVSVGPFFALGRVQFKVRVEAAGEDPLIETINGWVFFFYVMLT